MANNLNGNPLIVDTAADVLIINGAAYVKYIRWVGATTAGHSCVVQDKNGREVYKSVAGGANNVEESHIEEVINGLKVTTLSSGVLYLSLGSPNTYK